jgi:DNA-binding LacI/PurR family transcriptional regulator
VVGYDNGAVAAATDPPLTTVINPVVEMARSAGEILLAQLAGDGPSGPPMIFPPRLVVRSTS